VEVHDRDQLIQKFGETGSLFGEEPNDEMLGSPNTGSHEHFACFVCRYLTSFWIDTMIYMQVLADILWAVDNTALFLFSAFQR